MVWENPFNSKLSTVSTERVNNKPLASCLLNAQFQPLSDLRKTHTSSHGQSRDSDRETETKLWRGSKSSKGLTVAQNTQCWQLSNGVDPCWCRVITTTTTQTETR